MPRANYLVIFSVVAALIVIGSLLYSYRIVSRLAEKEERLVAFWADSYQFIATSDNCEAIFLSNNIIIRKPPIIHVPAIITDMQGIPVMNNLHVDSTFQERDIPRLVEKELARMKASGFAPIEVEYAPGKKHYVYYRETDELIQLRYYPYITFVLLAVFITIVAVNFNIAQRSRQNKLWAGLARETAHQLGTPLSGLIAWVELLKLKAKDEEDEMVVVELEKDIHHLQVIADRFSKIGSEPDLVDQSVSELLSHAVEYVRRRSSRRLSIVLHDDLPPGFKARISPPLFEWVIENLLKNAVDATVHREDGLITVEAHSKGGSLVIDVTDNGKGIARHDAKSVFQPGFTTKKRGWGLGLSLSRRIIERFHKGKIFIKRTEINKGTTFRLVIPSSADQKPV